MGKLQGKIALITGGTSGIGAATAERMIQEGATVIIVGRNIDRGKEVVQSIQSNYDEANIEFFVCDVCNVNEIDKLYNYVKKTYGKLDILFNNAGILLTCSLDEIKECDISLVYKTNLESVMLLTKVFMPMLQKTRGNIVNNASVAGMHSHTEGRKSYLYASAKASLIQFSKLCALNYAKDVRVNCICPGIIDTPIYTNKDYSRFNGIPMGRVGTVDEVANVVAFLVSEEASYLTGLVMPIDGGSALA